MSERYIKLNGDAVHQSPLSSFFNSTAFKVTGAMYAFNGAAMMVCNPNMPMTHKLGYLALGAIVYGASELAMRRLDEVTILRQFGKTDKCIDRKPDQNTVPTAPKDYVKAKKS